MGRRRQGVRPVTVVTYDSAAIHGRSLQGFGLLVFDEVHHLPADTYRTIAEGSIATARLGLSATPDRSDLRHGDLDRLVGPVVYERLPSHLRAARHIADYRTERISVALTDESARDTSAPPRPTEPSSGSTASACAPAATTSAT